MLKKSKTLFSFVILKVVKNCYMKIRLRKRKERRNEEMTNSYSYSYLYNNIQGILRHSIPNPSLLRRREKVTDLKSDGLPNK
jgi:hypothetical protein